MFKFRKIIAATLAMTTLLTGSAVSAFAATDVAVQQKPVTSQQTVTRQQPVVQAPSVQNSPQVMQPKGIRGWIVKEAVKVLALAFRKGAPYIGDVLAHLDAQAAKTTIKYAGRIANKLDEIASIPDLATNVVKDKMYTFLLRDLGLSGGTALSIADGIKRALDILVF